MPLNMDFVNGKGSVGINVTTQGNMVSLLKKALNGSLSVNLADGAVKGINLAKSVREMGKGATHKARMLQKKLTLASLKPLSKSPMVWHITKTCR